MSFQGRGGLGPVESWGILYYSLTVTFVSMLVAVLIGSIEVMGLVGDQFGLEGDLWRLVRALNDNFNALGFPMRPGLCTASRPTTVARHAWKKPN